MAGAIMPVVLVVALRSGVIAATRLTAGIALPIALWYGATSAAGHAPIASALAHFYGVRKVVQEFGPVPDFHIRPRFLLLTPLGLPSVLWSPFLPSTPTEDALRWHAPAGVLAVVFSLLFVGVMEPRYFAPVLPLAALVFWRVLGRVLSASTLLESSARAVRHFAVIVTCAVGVWPGHALVYIRQNLEYRPPFSAAFRAAVAQQIGPNELLVMPAILPLMLNGGHDVMYWLRRTVAFPTALRDPRDSMLADPDPQRAVCTLPAAVPAGTAIVIPRGACERAQVVEASTPSWWIATGFSAEARAPV
jgi:hypothetical protein